jgi:hypothetical protein
MIKNIFSLIGARSPFRLPAITKKDARSRVLFAGAIAGESNLRPDNAGNEGL